MDFARVYDLAVEYLKRRGLPLRVQPLSPAIRSVSQATLDFHSPVSGAAAVAVLNLDEIWVGPKAKRRTILHEWCHLAFRDNDGHQQADDALAKHWAEWADDQLPDVE